MYSKPKRNATMLQFSLLHSFKPCFYKAETNTFFPYTSFKRLIPSGFSNEKSCMLYPFPRFCFLGLAKNPPGSQYPSHISQQVRPSRSQGLNHISCSKLGLSTHSDKFLKHTDQIWWIISRSFVYCRVFKVQLLIKQTSNYTMTEAKSAVVYSAYYFAESLILYL